MRLYHVSQVIIPDPDIHFGRKNADFGQGFYMSPDRDFVMRWAFGEAYINEYELNINDLEVIHFDRNRSWYDYIYHNRKNIDTLQSDVVIGPIANDTIYDTFGIISSGYLSPEEALSLLLVGPEYTQVVIKTHKAASQLKWICSESFNTSETLRSIIKSEESLYLEQIAEALEKISASE